MAIKDMWSFKYHPNTFSEMILSDSMRETLKGVMDTTANVTLAGSPGVGKGTFVDFYIDEHKFDVKRINGSMKTGIDMVREEILQFASSFAGNKLVYINEADRISPQAQDSLDDLMEQVNDICRFILVCNNPERIDSAIVSRCPIIMYDHPPIKDLAMYCIDILKKENIDYNTKDVIDLVKQTGTDVRHTVNTLQLNCSSGSLSSNLNIISTSQAYDDVVIAMKSGDPTNVRKVLRSNAIDYLRLYEHLYTLIMDSDEDVFKNEGSAIITITDSAYRNETASAIKEITFINMMFKLLREGCL